MRHETIRRVYGSSGKEAYDSFMAAYFALFEESTQKAYAKFFEKLGLAPHHTALDVGIGTGLDLQFYPQDVHLVGLDMTPQMIETAKRRAAEQGRKNCKLVVHDGIEIPYQNDSFDRVVSTFYLCVAEQPHESFQEMVRVCRLEGLVGIFDYKKAASNPFVLKDQELLAETMRETGIYHEGRPAVVFDPLFDLGSLVESSGLEVVDRFSVENSFIESVGSYILRK